MPNFSDRSAIAAALAILSVLPLSGLRAQEVVAGAATAPTAPVEEVGELPAVVVESAPAPVINDRVPTPVRSESTAAVFDTIEVPGKDQSLLGIAGSASMGRASAEELGDRPFLRRGELLEVVPGMIITQHSGGGKANQYFVRGFNLDHGTDFAIFADAMPVNNRSHGHGQGYADINFLIPELVETLDYTKGPYFADLGDFSTAGSAKFGLYDIIPHGTASISGGQDDYFRFLFMDSAVLGNGTLSTAFEYNYYDGPWVLEDDFEKFNGFVKYYWEAGVNRYSITGMAYQGQWAATDQIPSRLVDAGVIDRLGFVDPTVGGDSDRYSLSFDWIHEGDHSTTEINAYVGHYALNLFSNFTYFLNDPLNGDQFNQVDNRNFAGLRITDTRDNELFGREGEFTVGFQSHHDFIDEVGLHNTSARTRINTVRSDEVYEANYSTFATQKLILNDWFKINTGVRADLFHFDVTSLSGVPANSGSDNAVMVSPKFGAVLGPWNDTELFFNWGGGFHSNDARGVITVDPATGLTADPLVRQWGTEVGARTELVENVTSSVSLWHLESQSELLYVGDAGTNEPGPATERYGIEWAVYWNPNDWLRIDSELAVSEAHFRNEPVDRSVENAVPLAFSGGITAGRATGPYGSLRARYFSERPLTADESVMSRESLVFNARAGFRQEKWDVYVELLNLFDSNANDIEYFYESRLPGEPAGGIADTHYHPMEPFTVRTGVAVHW
ncbi:MAG: TonB-dependent receptor plug domain-containing protein [Verrucomicrobiales bacterium]|nr:TonB-dependent receptor plug domain-containing protein [Verrucomicrobiales bacterium]